MKPAELERELTRLLEQDVSPSSLVQALREHGPDAKELGSLASRLALQGIPLAPPASAVASAAWKKWLLLGGGAAAVATAGLALREAPPPRGSPATIHEVSAQQSPRAPAPGRAGTAPHRLAIPASPAAPAPFASEAPSAADAPPAPEATVATSTAELFAGPTTVERPSAGAGKAVAGQPLPESSSRGATPRSTATSQDGLPPAGAPSELELLRDARLALRGSAARALQLTEQHAALYPRGKLVQERELLAISSLVALGRRTAALARGARFEQSFPTSPYRKQVGELLR